MDFPYAEELLSLKKICLMIGKIVIYILNVRRLNQTFSYQTASIIAMDEMSIWADMVSNTTIDKSGKQHIPLKSYGHEKVRVSVCER